MNDGFMIVLLVGFPIARVVTYATGSAKSLVSFTACLIAFVVIALLRGNKAGKSASYRPGDLMKGWLTDGVLYGAILLWVNHLEDGRSITWTLMAGYFVISLSVSVFYCFIADEVARRVARRR